MCLDHRQRLLWEEDKNNGLNKFLFNALATHPQLFSELTSEQIALFDELRDDKIDVLTLEQGTADWHKGRQFSLTSSQSDMSFVKAFINFQNDQDWCNIATYLEGDEYHRCKYFLSFLSIVINLITTSLTCNFYS